MTDARKTIWDIHEFKIWKGLDKEAPRWASCGFACSTWEDANSLMQYMESNRPSAIMRVVPHTSADLAATDEQAFANEKVKALVEAVKSAGHYAGMDLARISAALASMETKA